MITELRHKVMDSLRYRAQHFIHTEAQNIELERQRRALAATVDLVENSFGKARVLYSREAVLRYALGEVDRNQPGLYLEFGVYKAATINLIASLTQSAVHGFDSFEGLPEDWRDGHDKGEFRVAALPAVRGNVTLHKGWFSDTLPPFLDKERGSVCFLHVDCDLYSSTKTVFSSLADRLIPGTIIVFDEYFNYPGWQEGEYKAFMEFVAAGRSFEYLAYNCRSEQVAVRLL
jgi:hypothetical protein